MSLQVTARICKLENIEGGKLLQATITYNESQKNTTSAQPVEDYVVEWQ